MLVSSKQRVKNVNENAPSVLTPIQQQVKQTKNIQQLKC